jgi:hypothetical protein
MKTVEEWVALAVAVDHLGDNALNWLYVEKGVAYGSDGHRIHWGGTGLSDGFYDPETLREVKVKTPYPKIDDIINAPIEGLFFGGIETLIRSEFRSSPPVRRIGGLAINEGYLLDAMNGESVLNCGLTTNGIKGYSNLGGYLIMEVRI